MRLIMRPQWTAAPADGGGSDAVLDTDTIARARPRAVRRSAAWRARRALLASGEAVPTHDDRRYAAEQLRRAFARIDRDFSEAYEQCRNDAQRRALERMHAAAKTAALRAGKDELLEDADGWRATQAAFDTQRARIERRVASLKTATAVIRLRAKLAAIANHLAVLAC